MAKRRVLVTGGTRGLGASMALAFHEKGYNVAVTYASNDQAAKQFEAETGIKTYKWNVASLEECQKGIQSVEENLGGNIEILVNNAGITRDGFMHKMPENNWYDVISNNLNSVFNMTRCVIEKMRENKWGRIINISSVNAEGQMGQTNYGAAKAGIQGFTKSLALENARAGVTVNAIAPGYIKTEMVGAMPPEVLQKIVEKVPVGRLGEPKEIARTALFLADEDAGFITGSIISVNGGLRV